jgi:hypothetical protein
MSKKLFHFSNGSAAGRSPQFLRDGSCAEDEILFHHHNFQAGALALNPLVNRRNPEYARWGFYQEGVLTEWGDDNSDLLGFLTKLHGEQLISDPL